VDAEQKDRILILCGIGRQNTKLCKLEDVRSSLFYTLNINVKTNAVYIADYLSDDMRYFRPKYFDTIIFENCTFDYEDINIFNDIWRYVKDGGCIYTPMYHQLVIYLTSYLRDVEIAEIFTKD
jgi:hypothetical protein